MPAVSRINGSSPHTRGARSGDAPRRQAGRIIPAYAGSTVGEAIDEPIWADHPRIRGEHISDGSTARMRGGIIPAYAGSTRDLSGRGCRTLGSSPHTRGAQRPRRKLSIHRGIIPAYAGSTSIASKTKCRQRDHPRIRGEHHAGLGRRRDACGSSPHTRGAHVGDAAALDGDGIIPAYAGSTGRRRRRGRSYRDHPRIRGEHLPPAPAAAPTRTSSPHTRGALVDVVGRAASGGIIPAYAGSTAALASQAHSIADHPRIRGEHRGDSSQNHEDRGSSPHTRGARPPLSWRARSARDHPRIRGEHSVTEFEVPDVDGIIPAYAGSTSASGTKTLTRSDHPRIRGEHVYFEGAGRRLAGSSPHTRGAP